MALFCGTAWCLEQMVSVCVPDSGAIYMRGNFHVTWARAGHRKLCLHLFLNNCVVPFGFLPWEIQVAFPGESQLQQSSTTQPMLHAGCFSITIIHQTLTRITGSLTCICDLFACITYGDLGLWSHPKKIFFFFFFFLGGVTSLLWARNHQSHRHTLCTCEKNYLHFVLLCADGWH